MLTKTKIAVAAALILGTASAALAGDYASKTTKTAGKASEHVHGGYTGPEVSDRHPATGAVRPFTEFEWNRFDDFQSHE
jgi:hypothetical protein